jgi:hypothetical protein
MGTRDPRVDAYIAKSAPFARPILKHLRALVHEAVPTVSEEIKWGFPHFSYKGMFCAISAFKEHCAFGFWKHPLVAERVEGLKGRGEGAMGSLGRLTAMSDLPSDAALKKMIKVAAALNDEGVKVAKKKVTPVKDRVLAVPAYFAQAVKANKKAAATFDGFPYSAKKEYVEWVTEAKTDVTRDKRLATTVEWLAEGKRRNWKYENC